MFHDFNYEATLASSLRAAFARELRSTQSAATSTKDGYVFFCNVFRH